MAELGTTAPGVQHGWVRSITRYQWLVFFVVWAGWSLDAADFGLYSLVLAPALKELQEKQPDRPLAMSASKEVSFGFLVQILDALKQAGVKNLPTFTQQREQK